MTVDLSEFEALTVRHGPVCTVAAAIETVPEPDRRNLIAALEAAHITSSAISRWLKQRGVNVRQQTLQRHRRGECSCGR